MCKDLRRNTIFISICLLFFVLFCSAASASPADETVSITVHFSNVTDELQKITVDFCDDWLLQKDDVYNHKLMQASYAMAVSAFRSKVYEISDLDHDIRDFFTQAGFTDMKSDDFNKPTGINTIGTMIAHKKVGKTTLIAVSISGNNYQNEWLSNLTIEDEIRPKGFNNAAQTVMQRLDEYISTLHLTGDLRLWVAGYSRAAAVSNIFAADAVKSQKFTGVFAYTFATPRTTRETDPGRYHNIFNLINPEDVVPMIPFPEWGYNRYGIDLYLPSISTDSGYNDKYIEAENNSDFDSHDLPLFNPRMRRELHTFLDYIAYFVSSADSYTRSFQSLFLKFWRDKDPKALVKGIIQNIDFDNLLNSASDDNSDVLQKIYEFYSFIEFNARISFSSFISQKFGSDDDYWNNGLSLQENIAYGHYDKSYRFWLFSSDDPEKIFTRDPSYIHYTIVGDVNVEVLDERGDMICQFDRDGWYIFGSDEFYNPDFHGGTSRVLLYMERDGNQTMIELPGDQKYTIYILSNKDQELKVSTVEYSAEKLRGDVLYIYFDHYNKGEGYPEVIDPAVERTITKEQLETEDMVETADPWDAGIKYSPTAVMQFENAGGFLKKSLPVLILLQLIVNQLAGLTIMLIIILIRKGIFFIRKKVTGKEPRVRADLLELPEAKKTRPDHSQIPAG